MERLQRFLSRAGVASRRAAERLITAGRVAINGRIVTELGVKVDAARDRVTVDGRPVGAPSCFTYLMLHKPTGYLTTMRDPQRRQTILDLLPADGPRVYPVGRLDLDTSGLLLLTNDGDLAHALLHPSRGVYKTYLAVVAERPRPQELAALRRGVVLDDGPTAPAKAAIVKAEDGYATLEIKLHEGRKRQVRRMLAAIGHPVISLTRIGFGPIALDGLDTGCWRPLTDKEIADLRAAAGTV